MYNETMGFIRQIRVAFVILGFLLGPSSAAESAHFSGKSFGLSLTGGFPDFIGLDLAYLGWSPFVLGISFGSAPIQTILSSKIPLDPIPVDFSLPDQYSLIPNANFNLYSVSAYLKYFFSKSGFYIELLTANLTFGANVGGDLKNETSEVTSYSVVNGSARLNQVIIGMMGGFHAMVLSNLFIEGALGAGYLIFPVYSISIGGTISNVIGIVPNGEQTFNDAKLQIQTSFDSAMTAYRSSIKVLPLAFVNIGITF